MMQILLFMSFHTYRYFSLQKYFSRFNTSISSFEYLNTVKISSYRHFLFDYVTLVSLFNLHLIKGEHNQFTRV